MTRPALTLLALVAGLAPGGCTPTPPPAGGGVNTACTFTVNQTSLDLRATCNVTGAPGNTLLNPVSGGSACAFDSLSLFGQSLSVTGATLIWGENGDDSPGRLRIGVIVPDGSTHGGSLAKSAGQGCGSTVGPVSTVATRFGGRHVGIIDRSQEPHCVFQSRFQPSSFTQTVTAGVTADAAPVTRERTIDAIARQLDLEVASAVNRTVGNPNAMDAAFRARSGRCPDGYSAFTGP